MSSEPVQKTKVDQSWFSFWGFQNPTVTLAVHHLLVVDWWVQQKSIATNRVSASYGHHGTSETLRHLLPENSIQQRLTGWPRKDSRNRRICVWPQTQVQPRADQSRHMGFRHGRKRHWMSSSVSSTQQNERNLGGWSGTAIRRAWNNYYLWQGFTVLQPEQSRLHPRHG